MRLYLDEGVPVEVARYLRRRGHSARHAVADFGHSGWEDARHYQFAKGEKRIIVTLDRDFSEPRKFPLRDHPGSILLRVPLNATETEILARLRSVLALFSTAASLRETKVVAHSTHCAKITAAGSEDLRYLPTRR